MATINAVPIPMGDKHVPGPTFANLQLTGYMRGSSGEIILTENLATEKEIDLAVEHLVKEIEKAGSSAKKIISGGRKK